jgi:hypothetical protein
MTDRGVVHGPDPVACPPRGCSRVTLGVMVIQRIVLRSRAVPPSALAWKMREHGVDVEPWEAPQEDRRLGTDIVIGLIVNGAYDAIKAALADFLKTFPDAEATIEDDDGNGDSAGATP